jgi:anti-sigma factor RsiW
MSDIRNWSLPEQHLLPDAVVAFVDGELGPVARDRAASHIARCTLCAGETAAQRQARSAVRSAEVPGMSAGFLAALRAIPVDAELPGGPDTLAVTADGTFVTAQRPERPTAGLGSGSMLGSSQPLGTGPGLLRGRTPHGRRTAQGAGVVAAGLVIGALAMVGPHVLGGSSAEPAEQNGGGSGQSGPGVLQANFAGQPIDQVGRSSEPDAPATPSSSPSSVPSIASLAHH